MRTTRQWVCFSAWPSTSGVSAHLEPLLVPLKLLWHFNFLMCCLHQVKFTGPRTSSSLWMNMTWLVCRHGWRVTTTPTLQVISSADVHLKPLSKIILQWRCPVYCHKKENDPLMLLLRLQSHRTTAFHTNLMRGPDLTLYCILPCPAKNSLMLSLKSWKPIRVENTTL